MSSPHTPGDFFVDGTPHLTPHHLLDIRAGRLGIPRHELRLPPTVIATFFRETARDLAVTAGLDPEPVVTDGSGGWHLVWGEDVAIGRLPIGAPFAVSLFEQMVAAGARRVIVIGAAGSLQPHIDIGHLVIPTQTIREEGTSYHYLPAHEPAVPHPELAADLESALDAEPVPAHRGLHWTTDAIFREHLEKITRFREAGVLSVDMEVSALYAAAQHLQVECAAVLAVSDVLSPDEDWRHFDHSPSEAAERPASPGAGAQPPPTGFGDPVGRDHPGAYAAALAAAARAALAVARR